MKPLDLTKPVQTRNGEAVEILTIKIRGRQPVAGYIGNGSVTEYWNLDGSHRPSGGESKYDLINAPEKRTVEFWVNVYETGSIGFDYSSKGSADRATDKERPRIACLHIVKEFTVGEGL